MDQSKVNIKMDQSNDNLKKDTLKLIKYFTPNNYEKQLITMEEALEILEDDELVEFIENLDHFKY
jgi:hypothetical protein